MNKPKIVMKKLTELVPYERNPRKNDHAVEKAAGIIREFGFRVPVLIRGNGEIIDGHLRYKAAIAVGLDTVPCMLAEDMSEDQIKAFRLSIDRMADLAEWDNELLALELFDLHDAGYDVQLIDFDLRDYEEKHIKLHKLSKTEPPTLAWVLMSVPLARLGLIQAELDTIACNPDVRMETIVTGDRDEN